MLCHIQSGQMAPLRPAIPVVPVKPKGSSGLSSPGRDPKRPQSQSKTSKPNHVHFAPDAVPPSAKAATPAPAAAAAAAAAPPVPPAQRKLKPDSTTKSSKGMTDPFAAPVSKRPTSSAAVLQTEARRQKAREQAHADLAAAVASQAVQPGERLDKHLLFCMHVLAKDWTFAMLFGVQRRSTPACCRHMKLRIPDPSSQT